MSYIPTKKIANRHKKIVLRRLAVSIISLIFIVASVMAAYDLLMLKLHLTDTWIAFANYDKSSQLTILMTFLSIILIGPFTEELLYRGYALTKLRERFSLVVTIAIGAVIFSIMHVSGHWYNMPILLFQSIIFAVLFFRTKSIVSTTIAHTINNLVIVIASLI